MNKMNKWKVATICMIFVVFTLSISLYLNNQEKINISGIEITPKNYNAITEPLPNGQFLLCSTKDNYCSLLQKGGLN